MKKYFRVGLIIVSSLLFSACGLNKNSNLSKVSSDKNSGLATFTLRQLINQNVAQKCVYSGTNEEGSFESEIVVDGKRFKQTIEFAGDNDEKETVYTVSDGEYYYTWGVNQGQDFATKFKFDSEFRNETDQNYENEEDLFNQESSIDLDDDFQGTCTPTTVSDDDFQPPKNVEFMDYSQFLDDLKSSVPSIDFNDLE